MLVTPVNVHAAVVATVVLDLNPVWQPGPNKHQDEKKERKKETGEKANELWIDLEVNLKTRNGPLLFNSLMNNRKHWLEQLSKARRQNKEGRGPHCFQTQVILDSRGWIGRPFAVGGKKRKDRKKRWGQNSASQRTIIIKVGCQFSQLEWASFPAIKIKTNKSMSECHITIMTQGGQSTLFMKLD